MRVWWVCLIVLALTGYVQSSSFEEWFMNQTLAKIILYNDSVCEWNSRASDALEQNRTYTVLRGACNTTGDFLPNTTIHPRYNIRFDSVKLQGYVFEDGCGILYATGNTVLDKNENNTWVGDELSVSFATGCRTRYIPENNSFDDITCANTAGDARHREYILPVIEETMLTAGGKTCLNETRFDEAEGYVDAFRVRTVNCTVGDGENIFLTHTCRGATVVDSAYTVMGWERVCDREKYVKNCRDGCGLAKGSDCATRCTTLADLKCRQYKGERAICETPPSGEYGLLEDGSSMSWVAKPTNQGSDPCYCRYIWDEESICTNNRITLGDAEEKNCIDQMSISHAVNHSISYSGSYGEIGGSLRVYTLLNVSPDAATAFILGDIAYLLKWFAPAHIQYRIDGNDSGLEMRFISLFGGFNGTYNDSRYVDYAVMEMLSERNPHTYGERMHIRKVDVLGNGTYLVEFYFFGGKEELSDETIHVIGISERLSAKSYGGCPGYKPCPTNLLCLDEKCIDPEALDGVRLGSFLVEAKKTNLTAEFKGGTLNVQLTSDGLPLDGRKITCSCGVKSDSMETDEIGVASAKIPDALLGTTCMLSFEGEPGYGSAYARAYLSGGKEPGWSILFPAVGVFLLLGVSFMAVSGGRTPYDLYQTVRGWLR